ncbi:hypothetical protein [Pseudomonas sp. DE0157]|uniref:hypothetical protein n=1 Tax=Pseudomonas sp. DE0157 TaxID=2584952 RepID=UPI0011A1C1DF|nr:hypothetical protein [Pseudomonas sp. DE0157]
MPVTSLRKTCVRPSEVAKIKIKIKIKSQSKIKIKIKIKNNGSYRELKVATLKVLNNFNEWIEACALPQATITPSWERPRAAMGRAAAPWSPTLHPPPPPTTDPDVFPRIRWRFCAIAANIAG